MCVGCVYHGGVMFIMGQSLTTCHSLTHYEWLLNLHIFIGWTATWGWKSIIWLHLLALLCRLNNCPLLFLVGWLTAGIFTSTHLVFQVIGGGYPQRRRKVLQQRFLYWCMRWYRHSVALALFCLSNSSLLLLGVFLAATWKDEDECWHWWTTSVLCFSGLFLCIETTYSF